MKDEQSDEKKVIKYTLLTGKTSEKGSSYCKRLQQEEQSLQQEEYLNKAVGPPKWYWGRIFGGEFIFSKVE